MLSMTYDARMPGNEARHLFWDKTVTIHDNTNRVTLKDIFDSTVCKISSFARSFSTLPLKPAIALTCGWTKHVLAPSCKGRYLLAKTKKALEQVTEMLLGSSRDGFDGICWQNSTVVFQD